MDPDHGTWRAAVDGGVTAVFHADLQRFAPDRRQVIGLFRAVAWARGRGLPAGEVWAAVTDAVCDTEEQYAASSVEALLTSPLSAYLAQDREDGVAVYRLVHPDLRTVLRGGWESLLGPVPSPEAAG